MPVTGEDQLVISAYDQADLELLRQMIQDKLSGDRITFAIPAERGDLIALAHRSGEVLDSGLNEEMMRLTVRVSRQDYEQHGHRLQPYIESRE
ncbi:GTPase HflX [compost metagenome]